MSEESPLSGYWKQFTENHQRWRIRPFLSDGLVISLIRVLLIPALLYHYIVFYPLVLICHVPAWVVANICLKIGWCRRTKDSTAAFPRLVFNYATDIYMLGFTGVLAFCYAKTFQEASTSAMPFAGSFILTLCCIVTGLRLYEVFAMVARLHTKTFYSSRTPMRAVVNTFWHYFEVVLGFATFFIMVASQTKNAFGKHFLDHWFTPIYFSTITLATVGYGDHAPRTPGGRVLVVVEVICGLVLLVVAVQRVLAVKTKRKRKAKPKTVLSK